METMKKLEAYRDSYGIDVFSEYGEFVNTTLRRIVFENGRCAHIIDHENNHRFSNRFSVATCDHEGHFDWEILNGYTGAKDGCIPCDTEDEVIAACEFIRNL